jgi:hypothetical protein
LKIKNYKFERVQKFNYLGVILNEGKNHQIHLQGRIKYANKTHFMSQFFLKNNKISEKLKMVLKNTTTAKMLTNVSEISILTKRDRKQLNIFERKVY